MINELITRYPELAVIRDKLENASSLLCEICVKGGKILVCGNGGSCADSDHIVGELMKGFLKKRPISPHETEKFEGLCNNPEEFARKLQGAIPAISLTAQTALLSAFANDIDPDMAYAQLAYGYADEEDLIIGISTSGNSRSIVNAVIAAKARGASSIALTGMKESELSRLCDVTLQVPESETYKVQELHMPIYHYLCAEAENRMFKK